MTAHHNATRERPHHDPITSQRELRNFSGRPTFGLVSSDRYSPPRLPEKPDPLDREEAS